MKSEGGKNISNINNLFSNLGESSLFSNDSPSKITKEDIEENTTFKYSLISDYAYIEDKNLMYRNSMEDFHNIVECFDSDKMLFCIFDGHGGADTVKYVKDRVPELLQKYLTSESSDNALIKCFNKIDNELKFFDSDNNGTTATVVLILKENNDRILYCANVGDSKAILIDKDVKSLTEDHKCSNQKEIERINNSKGVISNGRVKGQLAITRTLGDLALKKFGVISTPYVTKHIINNDDRYIIIASDGLWDVFNDQDVYNMSKDFSNPEKFSKFLIKKAIEGGSKDNISCIVIKAN